MGCINCHSNVDINARLCPFCHTDPTSYGGQPYPQQPDYSDPNCDPKGNQALLAGLLVGGFWSIFCPPLGAAIIGLGVAGKIMKTCSDRDQYGYGVDVDKAIASDLKRQADLKKKEQENGRPAGSSPTEHPPTREFGKNR